MGYYKLSHIDDDGKETVVAQFAEYAGVVIPPPEPEPEPPPPDELPIAAAVLVDSFAVRSEPSTLGKEATVQTRLAKGANIFIDYLGDDTAHEAKYRWGRNVLDISGTRIGDFIAIENLETGEQFLDLNETEPNPKVLTGDIQPVRVVSPAGASSYRFKVGDFAWSSLPTMGLCTRSLAVSRQRIQQFYYAPDNVYINQSENEYWEMLRQANNAGQQNPVPMNAADWWFYAVHNEYMDTEEKQDALIGLIEQTLNDLATNNMRGGLVLKDALRHVHNIPAEYPYHTFGDDGRLNEAYYANKVYNTTFIPFLHKLMKRIGKHKGLGYIQADNEPYVAQSEKAVRNYLEFIKTVRGVVRQYNTTSPFGLRIENSNVIKWQGATNDQAVALFAPYVDFWQAHMYTDFNAVDIYAKWENQDRVYDDLFRLAPLHKLPAILDECMIRHENKNILVTDGSTEQMRVRMLDMFDKGLSKAIWWGYCQGNRDPRLTDNRGMTNVLAAYKGYYDMRNLYYQLSTVILPRDYKWTVA